MLDNEEVISIQLPKAMLFILKGLAKREGIDYQALILKWLDEKIIEKMKVER